MSKKESKDLVSSQPSNLMLTDLQSEFAGSVEVRSSLIKIPHLKLGQALSSAVAGNLGKAGEFTCEVRGVNFGQTVTIIPLLVSESASLMYPMDSEIQGVKCRSNNLIQNMEGVACASCPHGEYWNDWGTKDVKKTPKCKLSIDMIVLEPSFISSNGRMMLSFRSTSYPAGKALVNFIASDPKKIPFGTKYKLHPMLETNSKKKLSYYVISSNNIEKIPLTDEELASVIPIARQTLELKKAGSISYDHAPEDNENDPDPFK